MKIKVFYRAVDGFTKTGTFKTLPGAQAFAQRYVGETPDIGTYYAVAADGVGTIRVAGAELGELFPKLVPEPPRDPALYPERTAAEKAAPAPCPACGDAWYSDIEPETGNPYTCFFCCNGTRPITQEQADAYYQARAIERTRDFDYPRGADGDLLYDPYQGEDWPEEGT